MSKGVEAQLVVGAICLYLLAFINLINGLPNTNKNRQSLFSFLISRADPYSVPTAGKSYAVSPRAGQSLAPASAVVAALNAGIDEESRALGRTPEEAYSARISKYNAPLFNVSNI